MYVCMNELSHTGLCTSIMGGPALIPITCSSNALLQTTVQYFLDAVCVFNITENGNDGQTIRICVIAFFCIPGKQFLGIST